MKNCFSYIYPNNIKEISDEENVFDFYKGNLTFDGKRYKVKLPLKTHYESSPDNYSIAKSRLIGLQKQLNLNPELREKYDAVIKTYLDENILEEVKDDKTFDNVHYLPRRAVIKNERDTTKIRVAFDASAKSPKQPSLNDILYRGPCLLPLVLDILLRFRISETAVVADIQQGFLQISIAETHRNLRFLWFEDINNSDVIKTLRFAGVMFGLACSPFLLNATIRSQVEKHLGKNTEKLLLQFLRDLYVDNTATSFNDLTKATEFHHLTKNILAIGGFNLRQWETNDLILRNIISQEKTLNAIQNEKTDESTYAQSQLGFSSHAFRKVLGLNWDTNNDFLVYEFADIIAVTSKLEITKRNILCVSAMF